jgi:hypothetical protein
MLAPDMNARYLAITLQIALDEFRKADLPEPTRGILLSLLTIANRATAELCEALPPRCAIGSAQPRVPDLAAGENVFPLKRA